MFKKYFICVDYETFLWSDVKSNDMEIYTNVIFGVICQWIDEYRRVKMGVISA